MYIGAKEIESIDWNTVKYTDGTDELLSKETIELLKTEEPSNSTEVRKKKYQPALIEILQVLHKYNAKIVDLWYILDMIQLSCMQNNNLAISKVFWVNDKDDITLEHIHKVLTQD